MIINMIAALVDEDCYEFVAAWDEYTLDACPDEWERECRKWGKKYDIRIILVEVPDDTFTKAFNVPRVQGKIHETPYSQ